MILFIPLLEVVVKLQQNKIRFTKKNSYAAMSTK